MATTPEQISPQPVSRQAPLSTILLMIVLYSAIALSLSLFSQIRIYLGEWQQIVYPVSFVAGIIMVIGTYLLYRDSWVGSLLYIISAVIVLFLINTVPSESERRFYAETLTLLNVITGVGAIAVIAFTVVNYRQLVLRPQQLLWADPTNRPDIVLIAYIALCFFWFVVIATSRINGPFYNIIDRPSHGQEIRLVDLFFCGVALFEATVLLYVLRGKWMAVYMLGGIFVVDMIYVLLFLIGTPLFYGLRILGLIGLFWIGSRNEAYFNQNE